MSPPAFSQTSLAQAYELARQLYSSGAVAKARQACEAILAANPGQVETLLLLGVCLISMRQKIGAKHGLGD